MDANYWKASTPAQIKLTEAEVVKAAAALRECPAPPAPEHIIVVNPMTGQVVMEIR